MKCNITKYLIEERKHQLNQPDQFMIYTLKMPVDVGHLQLLFTVLSLSEAMLCRQYKGNIKANNKGTTQAPSDILFAASLLTCVSLCGNGCQCVSYNSLTKMCRLHSSCSPYTLTVTQTDWKTYSIVKIQPSSMYC